MKLVPTDQKVQIKWFWVDTNTGKKYRNNQGFIHNAWEASCSCGWETKTGGAIKAAIKQNVENHKWFEHDYTWKAGA